MRIELTSEGRSPLPNKPKFLVFEGINGAGKSTLRNLLLSKLPADRVIQTFEPGGTPLGQTVRSIVLGQEDPANKISSTAELLLFAADRAEHVAKIIKPALSEGKHVLCDRYFYSTLAFQGYGRGLDLSVIENICAVATGGLLADLVVLLDLDVETALARTKSRKGGGKDSFELEEIAFHERLRKGFLKLADERPEPFLVLSALESPEQLLKTLAAVVL